MNLLTFDIEDWFHTHQNRKDYSGHIWKDLPSKIEVNTHRILSMLDEHNLKATFFILGWVARHHPKLIKLIHSKGHEIAAHSFWHHSATLLTPEDFEKDLVMCLSLLQDLCGEAVTSYRAPGYSLRLKDQWAFDILAANGITADSSVQLNNKGQNLPLHIKTTNSQILEFPLLKSSFGFPFSGGGYFRVMPNAMHNYFFKANKPDNNNSDYCLFYFHPRDFDPENPFTNIFSFYRNCLNSYNTDICMDRLKNVLAHNNTTTLGDAVSHFTIKNSKL
jgi:polysaccharide deacetylase family protein (PEP-CTERM system associated)